MRDGRSGRDVGHSEVGCRWSQFSGCSGEAVLCDRYDTFAEGVTDPSRHRHVL